MLNSDYSRVDGAANESCRLSVLVATYDEEKTIGPILDALLNLDLNEIVVVDDGSQDRTAEVVSGFAARDPRVRLILQERNMGKTAAIARAIAAATGDILIVQDADLEYDPSEIPAVIAPILQGHRHQEHCPPSMAKMRRRHRSLKTSKKLLATDGQMPYPRQHRVCPPCSAPEPGVVKHLHGTTDPFSWQDQYREPVLALLAFTV